MGKRFTVAELEERQEELQTAIDDAADRDDGEAWEELYTELEDIEDELDGRHT